MSTDLSAFKAWLEACGRAWEHRNPSAAAVCFDYFLECDFGIYNHHHI
jgi:hypothetical protein